MMDFDEILNHVRRQVTNKDLKPTIKPMRTYASDLLNLIRHNCGDSMTFKKTNFTANGVEAVIKDKFDGQLYTITIKPLYQKE